MLPKYEKKKKKNGCPALELFSCLPHFFSCLFQWKTVRLGHNILQNATNISINNTIEKYELIFGWK